MNTNPRNQILGYDIQTEYFNSIDMTSYYKKEVSTSETQNLENYNRTNATSLTTSFMTHFISMSIEELLQFKPETVLEGIKNSKENTNLGKYHKKNSITIKYSDKDSFYKPTIDKMLTFTFHSYSYNDEKNTQNILISNNVLDIANKISISDYTSILEIFKKSKTADKNSNSKIISELIDGFTISKLSTKNKIRRYKLEDIQADLILMNRLINNSNKTPEDIKEIQDLSINVIFKLESSIKLDEYLKSIGTNEEEIMKDFEEYELSEGKFEFIWKGH